MLEVFGKTQQELLKEILKSQNGLSIDELTERLGITRTAVYQHLTALKKDGFVIEGELRATSGRPGRCFLLTQKGQDVFPRQYAWFSSALLRSMKKNQGSEKTVELMRSTAKIIAQSVLENQKTMKTDLEKMQNLVRVMNDLAYEAKLQKSQGKDFRIEAKNCVYHSLAKEHPEVCEFDLELMARMTDFQVFHQECMLRGSDRCCFSLSPKKKAKDLEVQ